MAKQRTPRQLVAAARAGSVNALDEIVRRYQDRIYALAYARLGNHHMAEDVAQATFVQALMSLGSIRKPESLPAWLCKVAVSQCRRLVQSNRRSPRPQAALPEVACGHPSPPEQLQAKDAADEVRHCLAALAGPDRDVLMLHYVEDMSGGEIASWLGISQAAVKKRLHTARRRLREGMIQMMKGDIDKHRPSRGERFAGNVRRTLLDLCRDELEERFQDDRSARRRWKAEAGQLDDSFGESFWRVAWRLIQFMRRHGIPCGPGRGRMPSSLIAYLLGISRINPLEFGLSCARDPDPRWSFIAFDVCHRRIDEVTGFVRDSWPGRVARVDRWPNARYRELCISPQPLERPSPAEEDDFGLPQIPADDRDRLTAPGTVRICLMGSQTITHIHAALEYIAAGGCETPDLDQLNWDESRPLALLSEGGLDQDVDLLDWDFIVRHKLLHRVRPRRFAELAAALAMGYWAKKQPERIVEYVQSKKRGQWDAPHPIVREQLAETNGLLLYDEQLAAILAAATGWEMWSDRTWRLQEALRQGDESATAELKGEILAAAMDQGIAAEAAQGIWDVLAANRTWYCKAHAVGYGVTIFQAAYLKACHPESFEASRPS